MEITKEELTQLLQEAEKAHAEYERELAGERDEQWAAWYAKFMLEKLNAKLNESS